MSHRWYWPGHGYVCEDRFILRQGLGIDDGTKVATAADGAATLDKFAGKIETEELTTLAGSNYTLTLTDLRVPGRRF